MNRYTAALAAVLLTAMPVFAQGNDTAPHSGFWLNGGLGAGFTDTGTLDDETDSGPAAYLRMGGTPSDKLSLGGEFIGVARDVDGVDVSQGNATLTALYYPTSPGGLFVKAGLGFANFTVSAELPGGATITDDESGFGLTFGAGYDVRLGRNFFLTPNLDILVQSFEEFADSNVLLLTLGLGFH